MKIKPIQKTIDFIRENATVFLPSYSVPYKKPQSVYEKLICVTGFLYSGSGAVIDLLSEYDNITTIAYSDKESAKKQKLQQEVEFFSSFGGVLELEQSFMFYYPYLNDLHIKMFITSAEYMYKKGGIFNDEYMKLVWEFINSIVDCKQKTESYLGIYKEYLHKNIYFKKYKNFSAPFVKDKKQGNIIYFPKNITTKEYRLLAQKFIKKFLKTIDSKEFLLLDQVFSNGCTDIDKLTEYFGEFKNIAVYRDPRDIYVETTRKNIPYIPRSPEAFVNWYKMIIPRYLDIKHKNFLMIKFEDLILNYDETKSKIEKFLEIDKTHHINPQTCLKPEISAKNIGIYKDFKDQNTIDYIYQNLKEYC